LLSRQIYIKEVVTVITPTDRISSIMIAISILN